MCQPEYVPVPCKGANLSNPESVDLGLDCTIYDELYDDEDNDGNGDFVYDRSLGSGVACFANGGII